MTDKLAPMPAQNPSINVRNTRSDSAGFSISVVAGGTVGNAVSSYYQGVKIYDKYKPQDSIDEVAKADYIFVAVPTPYNGKFDLTEMDDAISTLVTHLPDPERQAVIIKSTVLPGTTENYQKKYPKVNFLFNPEFLTDRTAVLDFANPDKQIVGYSSKTKSLAERVLAILPDAPFKKIVPSGIAEMAKYTVNSFYAYKVIFGNQIYDLCQAMGIDYDAVHEGLAADRRIVDSHFVVMHDGYRGYSGKCLPKDIKSLVWIARERGIDVRFLEQIIVINEKLISNKP